jgi:hypothetical protein
MGAAEQQVGVADDQDVAVVEYVDGGDQERVRRDRAVPSLVLGLAQSTGGTWSCGSG